MITNQELDELKNQYNELIEDEPDKEDMFDLYHKWFPKLLSEIVKLKKIGEEK